MLTVKRNHAKPPNGGHRFPNGEGFLRGETVDEVLEKMEAHRAENAQNFGDPEADLALYYQKIAPYLVSEVNADQQPIPRSRIAAEGIMRFWRQHPEIFMSENPRIALRVKVCEDCPYKRRFPKDEYSERPYAKRARQRAALLTSDREFQTLGWCQWSELPVDLITRVKEPARLEGLQPVPKSCWVKEI